MKIGSCFVAFSVVVLLITEVGSQDIENTDVGEAAADLPPQTNNEAAEGKDVDSEPPQKNDQTAEKSEKDAGQEVSDTKSHQKGDQEVEKPKSILKRAKSRVVKWFKKIKDKIRPWARNRIKKTKKVLDGIDNHLE